jgi:alpha-mannosidase
MINHGRTESTIRPEAVEICATKVFVASNVVEVSREQDGETVTLYQFDYTEYEKDEYIKNIQEKNDNLEQEITDAQLALCDVYEMIGG